MNDAGSVLWLIGLAFVTALISAIQTYWYLFLIGGVLLAALVLWWLGKQATSEASPVYVANTVEDNRVLELLRIYRESAELVATSANIETVDSRYGVMMSTGGELAGMSLPELETFRREFYALNPAEIFNAVAEMYITRQVHEISALKTVNGRERRVIKVEGLINSLVNMPPVSKEYAKKLLRRNLN